jgi:hypothetical protein
MVQEAEMRCGVGARLPAPLVGWLLWCSGQPAAYCWAQVLHPPGVEELPCSTVVQRNLSGLLLAVQSGAHLLQMWGMHLAVRNSVRHADGAVWDLAYGTHVGRGVVQVPSLDGGERLCLICRRGAAHEAVGCVLFVPNAAPEV